MLPAAQVGEAELEDIVKIGRAGEDAKALVGGGNEATERLLSDYEGLEKARMARTPRTAPQRTSPSSSLDSLFCHNDTNHQFYFKPVPYSSLQSLNL